MDGYLKCDKERLKELLSGDVENLLVEAGDDTWQEIRELFVHGIETSSLFSADIDKETKHKNLTELDDYARQVIHAKSMQVAEKVQTHMKNKFERFFTHIDYDVRVWNGKEDIKGITKTARIASIKLLSIMAAIRLDDDVDNIIQTLLSAFDDNNESAIDSLNSHSWAQVPPGKTLIKPLECKKRWEKFNESSECIVDTARKNWKAASGVSTKTVLRATGAVLGGVGDVATLGTCVAVGATGVGGVAAAGVVGIFAAGTTLAEVYHDYHAKNKNKNKKSTKYAAPLADVGDAATILVEKSLDDDA